MDKTKKYQVGSCIYKWSGEMVSVSAHWVSEDGERSIYTRAMEGLYADGIATEVKEKFKGSMVVDMTHEGYVHSHTANMLGMCDLSMEFGNIIRAAMGGHMATASKKFQFDITEL